MKNKTYTHAKFVRCAKPCVSAKPSSCAGTRSGVSLLIAIVLIAIISAVAMGISNLVTQSIRNTTNINRATEAKYAAEGALEEGLLLSAMQGAGFDMAATATTTCATGDNACATATVKIQGTVPANSKIGTEFVIPTPGTGTAGTDCNSLTAVTSGEFQYESKGVSGTQTLSAPAMDHPCNWNKIKVGETVALPLYTTTYVSGPVTNPTTITRNPVDLGLTNLKIKVRTPCKNGAEMCLDMDRIKLDTMNGDEIYKCGDGKYFCGDTIVSWQITGSNKAKTKTYTMTAYDAFDDLIQKRRYPNNSELYEGLINDALTGNVSIIPWSCDKNCVLYAKTGTPYQRKGKDITSGLAFPALVQPITDFLRNEGVYAPRLNTDNAIEKPILKLTVVHSLNDLFPPNDTIPYLEYQITTNTLSGTYAPADLVQTITAEGLSGTFKHVLEVKQPQETGLLEYVIQQ